MKPEKINIELLSAQLTFLGDYLSLIDPLADNTDLDNLANSILVLADILLLQSVTTGDMELADWGNKLTVLGDAIVAFQSES